MSPLLIDQIVERVATLPHLPDTVCRLITVVSQPDSTLDQIVEIIRYDQALTTEVLRLCNSAYFGLARSIESVDDAVCLLGTVRVFQLVMSAHARILLTRPQEGYGLLPGALWTHSIGVATGAQLLAQRMRIPHLGALFTGGLLHDTGKIVLNEFVAREYAEIARRVREEHVTFSEAEHQVLGYTHAELGGRLAEQWNLPPTITNCIRYHHAPDAAPQPSPLIDAVHLADAVCLVLGVGGGDDGLAYRAVPGLLERYNLSEHDLQSVGAEIVAELRSVQALFSRR